MQRKFILVGLLFILFGLNITSCSADITYPPTIDYQYDDKHEFQTSVVIINWWWFDNYDWEENDGNFYYPNSESELHSYYMLTIEIKSNLNNTYQILYQYQNVPLSNMTHSLTLDLKLHGYNRTYQTFMIKISYKLWIFSITEYSIASFIWNPQDQQSFFVLELDVNTIILLISLGFVIFGFGIYWYLYACQNVENRENSACQKQFERKKSLLEKKKIA